MIKKIDIINTRVANVWYEDIEIIQNKINQIIDVVNELSEVHEQLKKIASFGGGSSFYGEKLPDNPYRI